MGILCVILWGNPKLFSTVMVPFCIRISNVWGFLISLYLSILIYIFFKNLKITLPFVTYYYQPYISHYSLLYLCFTFPHFPSCQPSDIICGKSHCDHFFFWWEKSLFYWFFFHMPVGENGILLLYCFITNYCKPSSLKLQTVYLSSITSVGQELTGSWDGSFSSGSAIRLLSRYGLELWSLLLLTGTGGSQPTHVVVSRIQFFTTCWTEGLSFLVVLLEVPLAHSHRGHTIGQLTERVSK